MYIKDKICRITVSENENMDVAWLMSFAAEKSTVDPWTAKLLKRASGLLRETTGLCIALLHNTEQIHRCSDSAEERLLKAIFEGDGENNEEIDTTQ